MRNTDRWIMRNSPVTRIRDSFLFYAVVGKDWNGNRRNDLTLGGSLFTDTPDRTTLEQRRCELSLSPTNSHAGNVGVYTLLINLGKLHRIDERHCVSVVDHYVQNGVLLINKFLNEIIVIGG